MNHLAIIADGNRRWAVKNGLPQKIGYAQGLKVIENCCEWAIENNVKYLTFYCFSTENWSRSGEEIDGLMNLAREYFYDCESWYIAKGIHINFLGREDRLPKDLIESSNCLEERTKNGANLFLTICIDYGGRNEIVQAIEMGARTEKELNNILLKFFPEPDVILRTGGAHRLSNFLIWQSAYSELFFLDTLFPDLKDDELSDLKEQFENIKRNFGK